jgi:hypothetical protein
LLLGIVLFVGETRESAGNVSLGKTVCGGAVFVELSTIGLAIAYMFMRTPLGLGSEYSPPRRSGASEGALRPYVRFLPIVPQKKTPTN